MNNDEKFLVELLYKELELARSKGLMADEWFFKLISIAIIPFFVIITYPIIKPEFRIMLCGIPVLSILGILLIFTLANHYSYSTFYGRYLQLRINDILKKDEFFNPKFKKIFYEDWSSNVRFSFFISILLLIVTNLSLYPIIDKTLDDFYVKHHLFFNSHIYYNLLYHYYWKIIIIFFSFIFLTCLFIKRNSENKAKRLYENIIQNKKRITEGEVGLKDETQHCITRKNNGTE